jgi:hypothetical protein
MMSFISIALPGRVKFFPHRAKNKRERHRRALPSFVRLRQGYSLQPIATFACENEIHSLMKGKGQAGKPKFCLVAQKKKAYAMIGTSLIAMDQPLPTKSWSG